jgi:hypothetical protein
MEKHNTMNFTIHDFIERYNENPTSVRPTDTNKNGQTPAMLWIEFTSTEPLEWMRHDPLLKDKFGRTLAMLWVESTRVEPPVWMQHDPTVTDNKGRTLAAYWVINTKTDVLEWMKHSPTLTNTQLQSRTDYFNVLDSIYTNRSTRVDIRNESGP